ncbi:MAG: peptidoglycan-binding domain-containing protein [Cyanobacteria bacterium J06639_14]
MAQNQFKQLVSSLEPDTLKLEDSGPAVQALQLALKALSFYNSSIDGYFGLDTVAALRRFQQDFDLAATGQFDTATWYALTFWAAPPCQDRVQTDNQTKPREIWQLRWLRPFYSHR